MITDRIIRIGTRESQLAVWKANTVQQLLLQQGYQSELVYIKSEGDTDLQTPLYELGVQGIFTRTLDIALLGSKIDIAVHSMKDVPTMLPNGIAQAAVLKRASQADILVPGPAYTADSANAARWVGTGSIRRKAQWLHRYPQDSIENLRGNVNTRLRKVAESNWHGAIFAAAGLERLGLRPENAITLNWMLPAPAQGAIVVVCRAEDTHAYEACQTFNDNNTAICVAAERDFLRTLMGGCATPISAWACVDKGEVVFKGNVLSVDGRDMLDVVVKKPTGAAGNIGKEAAEKLLARGAKSLLVSKQ